MMKQKLIAQVFIVLPPIVCGIMLKGLLLRWVFREKVRQIMFVCEASECSAGNCQACIFNSSQFGVFFLSSVEFINIFQINSTTATACHTIAKRLSEKSSLVLKESVLQQWKNVDYLIQ